MLLVRSFRHLGLGVRFSADASPAPWCRYEGEVEMSEAEYRAFVKENAERTVDQVSRN